MTDSGRIIVAGAGPVGAVVALAAAQRGFPVTVVERDADIELDTAPRAATFHPSTLEVLDGLSIMDDFLAVGLPCRYFDYWDKPTRTLVARMDHDTLREDTPFPFVVQTEQHKLVRIALERLRRMPNVELLLGWRIESLQQDGSGVVARVGDGTDTRLVHGSWLAGCDGGRSTVRKLVGIEFEGYTWPERFAVLTTRYDFGTALGCSPRSYFADPDQWVNLFKVAGDDMTGRWRVVFPAPADSSDEEVLSDASSYECMAKLDPSCDLGRLVHRNIYNVHQRVAARFRAGRVFLAGDAAHVNNPIGGLGLNCGVHDAIELVDTLERVATGRDDEDLLDRYERRRRTVNIEFVQQQTIDNKRRLEEKDPAARLERLEQLAAISADRGRQREFLRRTSLLDGIAHSRSID